MQNVDPDFRQMALYDLGTALGSADFVIQESDQQVALTWVLKCFSESERNTEVVNNAVRVVGPLALKLNPRNQESLLVTLSRIVCEAPPAKLTPAEAIALRENASMSLKLAVQAFSKHATSHADALSTTVSIVVNSAKTLARGLSTNAAMDQRIVAEIFDVLSDYAEVYGADFAPAHGDVFHVCLSFLASDTIVRKRATKFLSRLAPFLSTEMFSIVTSTLTSGLQKQNSTKTFVEVCNAVCRTSAKRFDHESVDLIVSSFLRELQSLQQLPEDIRDSREVDETREQILSALECFLTHCKIHVAHNIDVVRAAVVAHVQWDPNFCVNDDEEMMEMYEDDDDMMDIDDGDTSWKVRIAAARCLAAIVHVFASSRVDLVASILEVVLNRLNERVEQVRLTIIDVLLKILEVSCRTSHQAAKASESAFILAGEQQAHQQRSPVSELGGLITLNRTCIVEKLVASSRHKDLKVKLGSVIALRELFTAFGTSAVAKPILSATVAAMESDPRRQLPALRPECLSLLLRLVVATFRIDAHDALRHELVAQIEQNVFPLALSSLRDRFFKTSLAALRVAQQLIFLALERPAITGDLLEAVQQRLVAPDSDIEMKRCALETIAHMISHLHQHLLSSHQNIVCQALQHMVQLLGSETLRVTVCKAVDVLAQAPNLPVAQLTPMTNEIVALLRKSDRQVREGALVALLRLAQNYINAFTLQALEDVVAALLDTSFIDSKDLFITAQSLALASSLSQANAAVAKRLAEALSPAVIGLLSSNHAQGLALEKCITFLSTCTTVVPEAADGMFSALSDAALRSSSLPSLAVLSSAIGATLGGIAHARGAAAANAKLNLFLQHQNKGFAFACIGSCGQHLPLSDSFRSFLVNGSAGHAAESNEDMCAAAALGLGRAASSPHNAVLLNDIATNLSNPATSSPQRQHALRALKEAITAATQDKARASPLFQAATAKTMLSVLLGQVAFTAAEDFFMEVIMEATGRLASLCIEGCVPELAAASSSSSSPAVTSIAVGAMKFVTPHTEAEEAALAPIIPIFLLHLNRNTLPVIRRGCIQLFHTTLMYRSHLLTTMQGGQLHPFLHSLFEELVLDKNLVSEVDLGPFKHRVDNGLELRKVAHECTQCLLDELQRHHAANDTVLALSMQQANLWGFLCSQLSISTGGPEEVELEVCNSSRTALIKIAGIRPQALEVVGPVVGKKSKVALNANAMVKDGVDQEKINDYIRIAIQCLIVLARECPHLMSDATFAEALKASQASDKFASAKNLADSNR